MAKMGPPIPAKSAQSARGVLPNGPPGVMYRNLRKRIRRSRTDPRFPTPGSRMTVVNTNSLKLQLQNYPTKGDANAPKFSTSMTKPAMKDLPQNRGRLELSKPPGFACLPHLGSPHFGNSPPLPTRPPPTPLTPICLVFSLSPSPATFPLSSQRATLFTLHKKPREMRGTMPTWQ